MDELVYETHPEQHRSQRGRQETLPLRSWPPDRYKDNRIPPRGFRVDEAPARLCEPVWHGVAAPDYFSPAEYAGGYDAVTVNVPPGADEIEVRLYYQTTSREFIEFLRDEINGTATSLPPEAYVIQTDPWFLQLRAWGDTIWQLWDHNKDVPGAAPILMAEESTEPREPNTVASLESGRLIGGSFVPDTTFARGEEIALRALVVTLDDGDPVRGAVVEIALDSIPRGLPGSFGGGSRGPLRSARSDASGYAIATWRTRGPGDPLPGDPRGRYTATVVSVSDDQTVWDGVRTSTAFTLE